MPLREKPPPEAAASAPEDDAPRPKPPPLLNVLRARPQTMRHLMENYWLRKNRMRA
jgi:hypothetical protein